MSKEIKFKSLNELYERVYPALNTRKEELYKKGVRVSELDIWTYLKKNKWDKEERINLCDMVGNILNLEDEQIILYMRSKEGEENED